MAENTKWNTLVVFIVSSFIICSFTYSGIYNRETPADIIAPHRFDSKPSYRPVAPRICPLGVRKQHLSDLCREWSEGANQQMASNIITDSSRQLLYCQVSKVACTKVKGLWELANTNWTYISPVSIHDHSKLKQAGLQPHSAFKLDNVTKVYTKFMMTRHPLERLISAYKNLLHLNGNGPYHSVQPLIKVFNLTSGIKGLTFPMFLQAITTVNFTRYNDPHWIPYSSTCNPCNMNYDYIARTETMQDGAEMRQVLKKLNYTSAVMKTVINPGMNTKPRNITNSKQYQSWFKDVPTSLLEKVVYRYRWDMKLFGYGFSLDDFSLSCRIKYGEGTCC